MREEKKELRKSPSLRKNPHSRETWEKDKKAGRPKQVWLKVGHSGTGIPYREFCAPFKEPYEDKEASS